MKRTVEEIISALETIRDVCKEFDGNCKECPLRVPAGQYTNVSCGIDNSYPRLWKVKRPDDWTALDFNQIY